MKLKEGMHRDRTETSKPEMSYFQKLQNDIKIFYSK